jgi:hypothetical protein
MGLAAAWAYTRLAGRDISTDNDRAISLCEWYQRIAAPFLRAEHDRRYVGEANRLP